MLINICIIIHPKPAEYSLYEMLLSFSISHISTPRSSIIFLISAPSNEVYAYAHRDMLKLAKGILSKAECDGKVKLHCYKRNSIGWSCL